MSDLHHLGNRRRGVTKLAVELFLVLALALAARPAVAGAAAAAIPPEEAQAKASLESSPRHHEWATVPLPGGQALSVFVAYPERKDKAPVVIVIQEVYGLTDWLRAVADRLAGEGFIAIAPDLLSGRGPGGGGTERFASRDDVVKAVRDLKAADVNAMLDATNRYGRSLPAATDRFATVGFCWGGGQSFNYAAVQPELAAAVVYYGSSPEQGALEAVKAPVLGLYGEDDARVNATVGPAAETMKKLGKVYVTHTYRGAGHGFLRAQDGREGANREAAVAAWPATVEFLKKYLEGQADTR